MVLKPPPKGSGAKGSKEVVKVSKDTKKRSDVLGWPRSQADYLATFAANLGVLYLVIGLIVKFFYDSRSYAFVFGLLCSVHIVNCLLLHLKSTKDKLTFVLIAAILNLVWIVSAVVMFCVYNFWITEIGFESDVVFRLSLWSYVLVATALAVCHYFVIKDLQQKH